MEFRAAGTANALGHADATVDSEAHVTELSAFDLTIVGAYVVPTHP